MSFRLLYNKILTCRSQWPRGLRRRSSAACPLRLWVRIPPGTWTFVCCECRVLSGTGLCYGLITRPEESYRLWRVCDQETSRMRRLKPAIGLWKIQPQWVVTSGKQTNNILTSMTVIIVCISWLINVTFSIYFRKKILKYQISLNNPSSGGRVVPCQQRNRKTDGQTDMTNLIVAFRTRLHVFWSTFF